RGDASEERREGVTETETDPKAPPGTGDAAEPAEPVAEPAGPDDEPAQIPDADEADEPLGFNEQLFEKENRRHEREVAKVFGDAVAGWERCGRCGGVGSTPRDLTPAPEVRADESLTVCPDCNGYGQRLTPSLDERYRLIPCTACAGNGYRDRAQLEA